MDLPHNGTSTSIAAAESKTGSAHTDRLTIYQAIKAAGIDGLTRDEIAERTGLNPNSVRPRVVELIKLGAIEEAGEQRHTATGRAAKVLTVVVKP
jgi:predicted ArsR family transcriptional regulator